MYDLQKSSTSTLPLGQGPSQVLTENGETHLAFHHTRTDKGCNLRAHVPAVTGSLQCSMDRQSSDGKAMLLKYVTSYVAKCHDVVKTAVVFGRSLCLPSRHIVFKEHASVGARNDPAVNIHEDSLDELAYQSFQGRNTRANRAQDLSEIPGSSKRRRGDDIPSLAA